MSRTPGLVAVAVFGLVALGAFGRSLDGRMRTMRVPAEVRAAMEAQRIRLAEAQPPAALDAAARTALERAVDLAFVDAFRWVMLLAATRSAAGQRVGGVARTRPNREAEAAVRFVSAALLHRSLRLAPPPKLLGEVELRAHCDLRPVSS